MTEGEKEEIIQLIRRKNGVGLMVGFTGKDERRMDALFETFGNINQPEFSY